MILGLSDKMFGFGMAGALALSVAGNVWLKIDNWGLEREVSTLDKQINDPETGYVTRLGTCRSNNKTLQDAIDDQNSASAVIAAEGAAAKAEAALAIAEAQSDLEAALQAAEQALNTPIPGANVCEQAEAVDQALLESLK